MRRARLRVAQGDRVGARERRRRAVAEGRDGVAAVGALVPAAVLDTEAQPGRPAHAVGAVDPVLALRRVAVRGRGERARAVGRQRERAVAVVEAAVERVLGPGAVDRRRAGAVDLHALVALHEVLRAAAQRAAVEHIEHE